MLNEDCLYARLGDYLDSRRSVQSDTEPEPTAECDAETHSDDDEGGE
jgi:hypothetical protein